MNILIIRHGDIEASRNSQGQRIIYGPDVNLSQIGIRQIQELSKAIKTQNLNLDGLYTSPYKRAIQSSEILKKELGIPSFKLVNDLRDVDPNSGQGHTFDELAVLGGDVYAHPFSNEQETLDHLVQRAKFAADYIISDSAQSNSDSICIVSHGDLISALVWGLSHTENPSNYALMKKNFYLQKGEAELFKIENGTIKNEGRRITVEEVNQSIEIFR